MEIRRCTTTTTTTEKCNKYTRALRTQIQIETNAHTKTRNMPQSIETVMYLVIKGGELLRSKRWSFQMAAVFLSVCVCIAACVLC